jgi:integrase
MALCLEALAYSFAEDFVEILVPFSVDGVEGLVARQLHGGGLRLMEALGLRMKDLDGEKRLVTVRSGQGDKVRNTMLIGAAVAQPVGTAPAPAEASTQDPSA